MHARAWILLSLLTPIALATYSSLAYLSNPSTITLATTLGLALISIVNMDTYYNSGKRRMPFIVRPFHALEAAYYRLSYNSDLNGTSNHGKEE